MSTDGSTERYCPHCEEEQPVIATVPWQEDLCEACRGSIPEE